MVKRALQMFIRAASAKTWESNKNEHWMSDQVHISYSSAINSNTFSLQIKTFHCIR